MDELKFLKGLKGSDGEAKYQKLTDKQKDLLQCYKNVDDMKDACHACEVEDYELYEWIAQKGLFAEKLEKAREYVMQKLKQEAMDFHVETMRQYMTLSKPLKEIVMKDLQQGTTQRQSGDSSNKEMQDNLKFVSLVLGIDGSLFDLVTYGV